MNISSVRRHCPTAVFLAVIVSLSLAHNAYASECETQQTSDIVVKCLGDELRASDKKINESYQTLMKQFNADQRSKLREQQRTWLKARDHICSLNSREHDRERWFQEILKDYRQTICVTRYTRQRIAALDHMLAQQSQPRSQPKLPSQAEELRVFPYLRAPTDPSAYRIESPREFQHGRWYFEVNVRPADIARLAPTAMWLGCTEMPRRTQVGHLLHIRPLVVGMPDNVLIGFALDLVDARFYVSMQGEWRNGAPGSSGGLPTMPGRTYRCGLESTVEVAPLINNKLIDVNFGDHPFMYVVPAGYRPIADRRTSEKPQGKVLTGPFGIRLTEE